MRKIGLFGLDAKWDPAAVDALFSDLDGDGSGELELAELLASLKKLKVRALKAEKRDADSLAEAAYWRSRAEELRAAIQPVIAWEKKVAELNERRTKPPAALRLANFLSKKQLNPSDLFSSMDKNKDGHVDPKEFARGLQALGAELTTEDLEGIHKQMDKTGAGNVDLDDVKLLVAGVHGVKEQGSLDEKKLAKDAARAEQEAKEAQEHIRAQLMEDQRKKEAAEQQAARAVQEKEKAAADAKARAQAQAEAKERMANEKKEQFEQRIQEKRANAQKRAPSDA